MSLPVWVFWAALLIMIIGLIANIIPVFPGISFIWLVFLICAVLDGFKTIGVVSVIGATLLLIFSLTSDFIMSQIGAKAGGASWKSMLAGLGGAILGSLLSFFLPGGIVICGVIGSLIGIFLVERKNSGNAKALRASTGLVIGFLVSFLIQFIIGLLIIGVFVLDILV